MSSAIDARRRNLLQAAGISAATSVLGLKVRSASATPTQASLPGSLRSVRTADLEIAYTDLGPVDGTAVILLHGWPYDIHAFAEVAPMLAAAGYRVIVPFLRGFGATRFLSAESLRNGQPAAVALDTVAMMDSLGLDRAILGGFDWGARSADIIAALWPERCLGLVAVSGYLIGGQEAGRKPLPPEAEFQWWYQFYFATERGRAGYDANRRAFAHLIWKLASPRWAFDDTTFARSAEALENPDHVDVVVHNYRWRQGLAQGEARYDPIEQRLAVGPTIGVPTITLEGDANGAPHPDPSAYAAKFTGTYSHRLIEGGVGHNLPQEAPRAFAEAIIDVTHP